MSNDDAQQQHQQEEHLNSNDVNDKEIMQSEENDIDNDHHHHQEVEYQQPSDVEDSDNDTIDESDESDFAVDLLDDDSDGSDDEDFLNHRNRRAQPNLRRVITDDDDDDNYASEIDDINASTKSDQALSTPTSTNGTSNKESSTKRRTNNSTISKPFRMTNRVISAGTTIFSDGGGIDSLAFSQSTVSTGGTKTIMTTPLSSSRYFEKEQEITDNDDDNTDDDDNKGAEVAKSLKLSQDKQQAIVATSTSSSPNQSILQHQRLKSVNISSLSPLTTSSTTSSPSSLGPVTPFTPHHDHHHSKDDPKIYDKEKMNESGDASLDINLDALCINEQYSPITNKKELQYDGEHESDDVDDYKGGDEEVVNKENNNMMMIDTSTTSPVKEQSICVKEADRNDRRGEENRDSLDDILDTTTSDDEDDDDDFVVNLNCPNEQLNDSNDDLQDTDDEEDNDSINQRIRRQNCTIPSPTKESAQSDEENYASSYSTETEDEDENENEDYTPDDMAAESEDDFVEVDNNCYDVDDDDSNKMRVVPKKEKTAPKNVGMEHLHSDDDDDCDNETVIVEESDDDVNDVKEKINFTPDPKKETQVMEEDEEDRGDESDNGWIFDSNRDEYYLAKYDHDEQGDNNDNDSIPYAPVRIPSELYRRLYSHQKVGVRWMASLHNAPITGGILGDDMGMGKTYQTLTYIGGLMKSKIIRNALIICPLSLMRTWEREGKTILQHCCVPRITINVLASDVRKQRRTDILVDALTTSYKYPQLVITTYGLVASSPLDLIPTESDDGKQWDYVILDEGHKIKNPSTKVTKGCHRICRNVHTRRMLLTGTPIQNNLKELWSLFDWVTDGKLLGKCVTFKNKYSDPIELGRHKNASEWVLRIAERANKELQDRLRPHFIQRLKKTTFQDELPTKRELVVWTHLSPKQRDMYKNYVESEGGRVASVLSGETASPLEAITWLKKLCGHPQLVCRDVHAAENREYLTDYLEEVDPNDLVRESAKLRVLVSLVRRLQKSGHRTLIFSQSTMMLDIIERVLEPLNFSRIDGQTKERARQNAADEFNAQGSDVDVMLLSTKAAGLGLTLTGADRAIIYDPSWNPADDSQAVDRCYRIGQRRNVTVYRFIAAGTVEERMYEKQVLKDGIRRAVLTSGGSATERYFDKNELRRLFHLEDEGVCAMLDRFSEATLSSSATGSNVGDGSENDTNGSGNAAGTVEGGKSTSNSNKAPVAVGGSGKPSFLGSHKCVVGISSHDMLYTKSVVDLSAQDSSRRADQSPFAGTPQRAQGRSARVFMESGRRIDFDDNEFQQQRNQVGPKKGRPGPLRTLPSPSMNDGLTALGGGGINKSRQQRLEAKRKVIGQEDYITNKENGFNSNNVIVVDDSNDGDIDDVVVVQKSRPSLPPTPLSISGERRRLSSLSSSTIPSVVSCQDSNNDSGNSMKDVAPSETINTCDFDQVIKDANDLISEHREQYAMSLLLKRLEKGDLGGERKLQLHKKIATLANGLGWL